MKFALIIPCYNEASRLSIESYENFIVSNPNFTLFFVDDGSTDQTLSILKRFSAQYVGRVIVLSLEKNSGKAEAVRRGIGEALSHTSYDYLGYWDADLTTPLSEICRFEKFIQEESPWVVLGSRVRRAGAQVERIWYRHILGRLFATVVKVTTGLLIYDTQCSSKFFKQDIAKTIFNEKFISNYLFYVELFLRLKREFGEAIFLEKTHELSLTRWKDISASKVKPIDFLKAPIELYKILKDYR
ncbi:glycosyltransferase [Cephaloticoccus capnophilus]|uniref:glycosyltransferase n=1 Tax=Cephaloticoccus capnophilus TaxID=1548208 RepID=UPI0008392836|nr:glycosyltransferase [Cephaloticoccus capnophilus]